tara:strand:- start:130 stop:564 length:435 start_codon:yes stop_codon:yes gene_type:complete
VDVARSVAGVNNAVGGSGGGIGDLEGVLRFLERAVPLFEQAGTTLMKMRAMDAQSPDEQQQFMVSTPTPPPPPAQAPGPTVIVAPKLSPIKVYSAALGALADLEKMDPELSIGAALKLARDYKDMILPMIEEKLPELMEDEPNA